MEIQVRLALQCLMAVLVHTKMHLWQGRCDVSELST